MSNANNLPEITLDELSRLIRMLGMLGSDHEGEVLAAARFAVKWVRDKGTDWETLLTPEPEQGVTGVVAHEDLDALEAAKEAAKDQAYRKGYAEGLKAMAAQVRAQAAVMQASNFQAAINAQLNANQHAQQPHAASQGLAGGPGSPYPPSPQGPLPSVPTAWAVQGASNPYTPPCWQYVAWELLHNDATGMPGVFRGSREQDFVADLLRRHWPTLTTAQDNWLRDIAGRSGMTW